MQDIILAGLVGDAYKTLIQQEYPSPFTQTLIDFVEFIDRDLNPVALYDWFECVCEGMHWNKLPSVGERAKVLVEAIKTENQGLIPEKPFFTEFIAFCQEIIDFYSAQHPSSDFTKYLIAEVLKKIGTQSQSPFFDVLSEQILLKPYVTSTVWLDYLVEVIKVVVGNDLVDRKVATLLIINTYNHNARSESTDHYLVDLAFSNSRIYDFFRFCSSVAIGLDE